MYYLIKLIRNILLKLPLSVSLVLGKVIGLSFYLNSRRKRVAFKNIKSAFPQKTYHETLSILKKSFDSFGLTIVEILIAPRIYKYVELKEQPGATYENGGIFVGIHAGNWEIEVSYWAQKHKFAIFAQQQKNKGIDKLLNELRKEGKIRVCFTLRELIRCLRQNYMVGVVIDHGAEVDAPEIEFFSHLVPTPKGGIYLAKKFNKKIYPAFCHRCRGFSQVIEIGKPIDPGAKDDKELLRHLNKIYEDYLRKYPWEYFWYYKRFKRKINRDALILSDGKTGHLKQSKALLSLLSEEDREIRSRIIEVRYKNKFCRAIADVLAYFCGKNNLRCANWLAFVVDKETWERLDKIYADIVISTGSFAAPINKLFSSYLGAKSAVILRPNIPLRKFDLALIPKHDRLLAKGATIIKGALCYPDNIEEKIKKCKDFFSLSEEKKISLFFGGPLQSGKSFVKNLQLFIDKIKDFSLTRNYKILVSTSRRTPPEVENCIEKALANFKNTEALVMVSRTNYDFVFEGFGGISDIVFMSSESISMVSEVTALKKPCVCVSLEDEDDKRKVFFQSLKNEVAHLGPPYDINPAKLKASSIFENNKKIIKEAIKNIL